jgi:hypothetical protein
MGLRNTLACKAARRFVNPAVLASCSFLAFAAHALGQESGSGPGLILREANPNEQGDRTLGPAAREAIKHGPLPFSDADVAAKAAANRARDEAEKTTAPGPFLTPAELAAAGETWAGPVKPVIGFDHEGRDATSSSPTPPDTTGAIGPSSYVQLVNSEADIYNRSTGALIGSGTFDQLAGIGSSVSSFDPQVIWDATTSHFYYTMDSIFSSSDNRLSFGISKTGSPSNVTTDWCHYTLKFGTPFPDFPKLGDSKDFIIIGTNVFANDGGGGFTGSKIVAISKAPAGTITTCPTVKFGETGNLKDTFGSQVFTPVPANQIDSNSVGYVVARNGTTPSTRLWFFNVTKGGTGLPVFSAARGVTVSSYSIPAAASQPTFTQLLDTSDARNTQAVQAIDSRLGTFSFWTQHTIASGTVSAVRWYEINPVPAAPVLQRSGNIAATGDFLFNASISPDRRAGGFGNSFIIDYNVASKLNNINPRIVVGSSVNGAALSFSTVINSVAPYRDFSCPSSGETCRWGDYSGASPDPNATLPGSGVVWGTNQWDCVKSPSVSVANWCTRIFADSP